MTRARFCNLRSVLPEYAALLVALLFGWVTTAHSTFAAPSLQNIVETGSPYPGGGAFNTVTSSAIDDGVVCIFGRALAGDRLSLLSVPIGGMPSVLVAPIMPVPSGTGNFYDLTTVDTSFSEGNLLFSNRSQNNSDFGVYLRGASGVISRIADRTTSVPGAASTFTFFYDLEQAGAAKSYFLASGNGGQNGYYVSVGGTISTVVDKSTLVPGQNAAQFTSFESFDFDGGLTAFAGSSNSYRGIFTTNDDGQTMEVIADNQTPMPNYAAWNFDFLGNPLTNGEDVIFYGRSAKDPNNNNFRMEGVYGYVDGAIQMLVDLTTLNPRGGAVGAGGGFGKIEGVSSFDGDLFTFAAEHDGAATGDNDGIYFGRLGGELQLLIEEAQTTFDGNFIEDVQDSFVDGNQINFSAHFDDNTSAVYVAQIALLPGDYNNDRSVNAADYTVWRNMLGQEIALPNEDDSPGVVTAVDYAVWKSHFGESLAGITDAGASARSVPEPPSILLLLTLVSSVQLSVARRRQSNSLAFSFTV